MSEGELYPRDCEKGGNPLAHRNAARPDIVEGFLDPLAHQGLCFQCERLFDATAQDLNIDRLLFLAFKLFKQQADLTVEPTLDVERVADLSACSHGGACSWVAAAVPTGMFAPTRGNVGLVPAICCAAARPGNTSAC